MGAQEKVLIVSDDTTLTEDLRSKITNEFPQIQSIESHEVRREIVRLKPDIVLLHEPQEGTSIQLLPYISKEVPDAVTIFLTERRDPVRTRDVNRAGAFDILFLPDEIHALDDVLVQAVKALQSKSAQEEAAAAFSWAQGQVVSFYSGKGGSGRSLTASTLAQTIGLDSNASVLLVDLNLQFGGLETILKIDTGRHIFDLDPVLNELNDNHIRSVTAVEERSQIEVLPSPKNAEIAEQITEDHVQRLLRTARLYYDYILVDLPTEMTTVSYTVLEESDYIFYVMIPDMLSMSVFRTVLDLFSKLGIDPNDRLQMVLNRISRDTEIGHKDVNRHFLFPVIANLRDDTKRIQQLINQGKLVRNSRKERGIPVYARDVQKLASWLLKQQTSQTV
ncbi:AAA family ATPase [Melghirimyces algeriensis]|uniref:Pilus assembly protein CpaE n=1 Tax=Melghirimyces algeriensis TaxID=910412 RepID=A0A521E9E8_9BACL|nr:AAA family ATPase [Melghirimyces algeriensis]SMO80534.1 pilus assembly protein CpaE [Melghirimyces algeriensis]